MDGIFKINIQNGEVSLNENHEYPVKTLVSRLIQIFGKEKYVDLFFWSFRTDEKIAHAIKISNRDGNKQYRINILESNEITFSSGTFFGDVGEITVLDSADVTWLIHYIELHLPHIHLRKGIFNKLFKTN